MQAPSTATGSPPSTGHRSLRVLLQRPPIPLSCTIHINGETVLRLQVEYCFTGEGSDAFPAPSSLRGLDAGIYYRTGSLLNAGHAAVRALILDSLKHWGARVRCGRLLLRQRRKHGARQAACSLLSRLSRQHNLGEFPLPQMNEAAV